jgi:RES domain-containing protein
MVHTGGGRPTRPYVSFRLEIPDNCEISNVDPELLIGDWQKTPAPEALQDFGTGWVQSNQSAVLRVPSAVVAGEFNYLLNPSHNDFPKIRILPPEDFVFDRRLLVGDAQP